MASASHFDDLELAIYAEPTVPERMDEAAEAEQQKVVHIFNLKRNLINSAPA